MVLKKKYYAYFALLVNIVNLENEVVSFGKIKIFVTLKQVPTKNTKSPLTSVKLLNKNYAQYLPNLNLLLLQDLDEFNQVLLNSECNISPKVSRYSLLICIPTSY